MTNKRIKILYITSLGHSGSTLLDVLLGQHSQLQSLGELAFFDTWIAEKNLCSCGTALPQCPFWINATAGHFTPVGELNSAGFLDNSYKLFQGIQAAVGAKIIVDSSKSIHRLTVLLKDPRFEVKVVHLIRNGLAVVNSLTKSHRRPGSSLAEMTPPTPLLQAILRWTRRNKAIDKLMDSLPNEAYTRVRYEDLCTSTEDELSHILDLFNLNFEPDMLQPSLANNHNISGSRWRFQQTEVRIELSRKWQTEMGSFQRWLFSLLGSGLNRQYGYSDETT